LRKTGRFEADAQIKKRKPNWPQQLRLVSAKNRVSENSDHAGSESDTSQNGALVDSIFKCTQHLYLSRRETVILAPRSSFFVIWKSRRAHSARFLRVCRRTGAKFTLCGHAIFHCCQAVCHMFCHPSRAADTSHRTHIAAAGEKIKPAVQVYICGARTPSHCAAEHRAAAAVTVVIKRSPVHAAKWCVGNVER
jgi:hypothetical protein